MNQDFGLLLTPANARRLLRFQKNFSIELSNKIVDIANDNRLNESHFDPMISTYNEECYTITQFIVDCDLRAIFQQTYYPAFTETDLMNAVRIVKPKCITVFTERKTEWRIASQAMSLNAVLYDLFHLSNEEIDGRREGVLIIDLTNSNVLSPNDFTKLRNFGSEFQKTIIFQGKPKESYHTTIPWPIIAQHLFPTMPHPLYPRIVADTPQKWTDVPLSSFAPFYNTCIFPELITDSDIMELLTDKKLHHSLQQYRGLLTY